MTAVIQKLYAVRARFHAKAAEIKQFVRLHRIENDLKRRIEDYFLTHWSVSKGVDSDEVSFIKIVWPGSLQDAEAELLPDLFP